jgi:hypothetical protein
MADKEQMTPEAWRETRDKFQAALKKTQAMPDSEAKRKRIDGLQKFVLFASEKMDLPPESKGPLDYLSEGLNYGSTLLLTTPVAQLVGGAYGLATGKDVVRPMDDFKRAAQGPLGPGAVSYPEYFERGGASPEVAAAVGIPAEMAVTLAPSLLARYAAPNSALSRVAGLFAPASEMAAKEKAIAKAAKELSPDNYRKFMAAMESNNPGAVRTAVQAVLDPVGLASSRGARAYGDTAFTEANDAAAASGGAPWKPSDVAYRNKISGWTKKDLQEQLQKSLRAKTETRANIIGMTDAQQEQGKLAKTRTGELVRNVESRIDANPEMPPELRSQIGEKPRDLPPRTGLDVAKEQVAKDFYPYSEQAEMSIKEIDDLRRSMNRGAKAAKTWVPETSLPASSVEVDTARGRSARRYGYGVGARTAGDEIEAILQKTSKAGENLGTQEHVLSKELQSLILAKEAAENAKKISWVQQMRNNPVSALITAAPGLTLAAASKIPGMKLPALDLAAAIGALGTGMALNSTAAKTKLGYGVSRYSHLATPAVKAWGVYQADKNREPTWADLMTQLENEQ